jgi:hypothetical protein
VEKCSSRSLQERASSMLLARASLGAEQYQDARGPGHQALHSQKAGRPVSN